MEISNNNYFHIRKFYKKREGYNQLDKREDLYYKLENVIDLISTLQQRRGETQIMELNVQAPGGPGYERQLTRSFLESLGNFIFELKGYLKYNPSQKLENAISRLEEFQKIYEESINKHPYLLPDLNTVYGKTIVDYAKNIGAKKIFVLVVDPSLLSPQEETTAIFQSIQEVAQQEGIIVEATDLENLLSQPRYEEIRNYLLGTTNKQPSDMLVWRDFTLEEVWEFLRKNYSSIEPTDFINRLISIPTINPYEIANTGGRNWPKILGVKSGDLVPIIIPGEEILINSHIPDENNVKELRVEEGGTIIIITRDDKTFEIPLYHGKEKLNLNNYVLKIEGTFGGKGVLVNSEEIARFILWESKKLEKSGETQVRYVLEKKVKLPITIQPLLITPLRINDPRYEFKLSKRGYLGIFNVDLRILLSIHKHNGERKVSIVGIFCRFNYPDRPSNVSSGGGILPLIVLPQTQIEEFYKKTFELFEMLQEININIENRKISALERLYEILTEELRKAGFTVYGKNILFGVIPYVVSEEKIEETIKKLQVLAEKIQDYNSKDIPFYVGFDLALSPF
ncbi:MAG: hypothetical protein QW367_03035 [Candidatus Aenigmatarchaeota archaeon]